MTVYRTIVADPPWDYPEGTGASYSSKGRRNCDLPYGTMTVDEIAALPVRALAERSSSLFLWTTNRYRHSLVVVFTREDAGETVLTCADCGCEVDVKPQPHSPACPTLVSA